MDLLWPGFLILLALIPLIIAAYIFVLRRRKKFVVRYSSLSLVMDALPKYSRLRRYLPVALFIAGLASLLFALDPASVDCECANQPTHNYSGDGCVAQHVLHRHRAKPVGSSPGRRTLIYPGAAARYRNWPRGICGVCRSDPTTHNRQGGVVGSHIQPDGWPAHSDRQQHP